MRIACENIKNTVISSSHSKKNFIIFLSIAYAMKKKGEDNPPEGFREAGLA